MIIIKLKGRLTEDAKLLNIKTCNECPFCRFEGHGDSLFDCKASCILTHEDLLRGWYKKTFNFYDEKSPCCPIESVEVIDE